MPAGPHPDSVVRSGSGREVQLKVHQCFWSGAFPGNSLAAIQECYRSRVARAEIDLAMLADEDYLVVHDLDLSHATDGQGLVSDTTTAAARILHLRHRGVVTEQPVALLSEVVDAISSEPYPTLLELDLKDTNPWPWPRAEELARLLQPIKDRVTFGGGAHWNLRRLGEVDATLRMGFTPDDYLDWPANQQTPHGARERFEEISRLVPNARDIHVRLAAAQRMVEDGLADPADLLHRQGMLLDLWTLNVGAPGWHDQLCFALDVGADVITSHTPRELARAARETL